MPVSLGSDDFQGYFKLSEWLPCNKLDDCRNLLGPLCPLFAIDFGLFKNFVGSPIEYGLGEKRDPGEMVDFQGSPPQSQAWSLLT